MSTTETPIDLGDVVDEAEAITVEAAKPATVPAGIAEAQAKLEAKLAQAQRELQALHAFSQLSLDDATVLGTSEFYVQVTDTGSQNYHVVDMSGASWMTKKKFYIPRENVEAELSEAPVAFKITMTALSPS